MKRERVNFSVSKNLEIKELSTGIEINVMIKAKIMRIMMLMRTWILLELLHMLHMKIV